VRSLTAEARGFEAWARSRGYEVVDSESNFSLIGRFPDRHAVWQALLDRGILIRETGPAGFLRVSAGTPDEMTLLKAALDDIAPEKEGTTP
jgi:histidinol-phosphate aminotransferase